MIINIVKHISVPVFEFTILDICFLYVGVIITSLSGILNLIFILSLIV